MPAPPDVLEHLAAARGEGLASASLPAEGGRPRLRTLAALREPDVLVPAGRAGEAVDVLGAALDAVCADAGGPAELPVATLWLSYDAARAACDPRPLVDRRPLGDDAPAAFLARHAAAYVVAGDDAVIRAGDTRDIERALREARERPAADGAIALSSPTSRDAYLAAVQRVRSRIGDGHVYLVNVARRLDASIDIASAADLVALRVDRSRAPRAFVARAGGVLVGGMSMELALRWDRRAGLAETAPIKGTRPRRDDPGDDAREAAALRDDPKERAENAMAVDVHRNDLGRVAVSGGVTVPSRFEVEGHAFVHHLVSRVRAEVPRDLGAAAMLRAVLPVGSVTGAPKLAAMDEIARVEPTRRGLYTGVYGHVFGDGAVELTVAIRTVVVGASGLRYGVGGGIVWDSDPAREWDELGWKSRALR